MKRDMDLIRLLLLEYEGPGPNPDLSAYTEEQRVEHSALLIEAGFVHGQVIEGNTGLPVGTVVLRLTWAGHDFLAAARSDSVWRKVGDHIKKAGVQVPLSILQELLKHYLKQTLGIP